jgi:hypothetical protein
MKKEKLKMNNRDIEIQRIRLDFSKQLAKEVDEYNIEKMCQNCTLEQLNKIKNIVEKYIFILESRKG